jgi:hypothetical protein
MVEATGRAGRGGGAQAAATEDEAFTFDDLMQ